MIDDVEESQNKRATPQGGTPGLTDEELLEKAVGFGKNFEEVQATLAALQSGTEVNIDLTTGELALGDGGADTTTGKGRRKHTDG